MDTFQSTPQAAFPGKGCLWDFRAEWDILKRGTPSFFPPCADRPGSHSLLSHPTGRFTCSPEGTWVDQAGQGRIPACLPG